MIVTNVMGNSKKCIDRLINIYEYGSLLAE